MKYTLEFVQRTNRHIAVCSACPWKSTPQVTAGLAGSAFDTHKEKNHGTR